MRALAAALTAAALLATASSASASTVGRDTTEVYSALTYDGDASENRLVVDDTDADYIFRDTPGETLTPERGCRPDDDDTTDHVVLCAKNTSGVITLNFGDGDDEVTTDVNFVGFLYRGGDGADVLRASTGFRSSVTMIGGPGTDVYVPGRPGVSFEVVSYSERFGDLTATMNDVADDPDGETVPSSMTGVVGGQGDDTLTGTGKGDYLAGAGGQDHAVGLGGPDNMNGSDGDDLLEGGDGNDRFPADPAADRIIGGEGFDRHEPTTNDYETFFDRELKVTLDDVANDGGPGERDDVRSDVEDVTVQSNSFLARSTIVGDDSVNVLRGSFGADTLDGARGGDLLDGRFGDDTIRARDGFVDRIQCGPGDDTAIVDADDLVDNCETVDRAARPSDPPVTGAPPAAADDRPPTVAFSAPLEDALIATARPSAITVDAADDRAVTRVLLMDDGRVVGVDDSAPYRFDYQPTGDDVGRNTLVAVAVDAAEQTGTAVRPVRVDRFLPVIRAAVRTARDRRAPYRFRVAGALRLLAGVDAATACRAGVVSVQVKRGTRTISTRRARLTRACGFASTVTFRDRRRLGNGRLKVTARFLGTRVLAPRTARSVSVRAG